MTTETLALLRWLGLKDAEQPYDGLLDLVEHERREIELGRSPSAAEMEGVRGLLRLMAGPQSNSLLSISVTSDVSSDFKMTLKASEVVGFTSASDGDLRIFVQVRPKVETSRMIELAGWAGMLPPWSAVGVQIGEDEDSSWLEGTLRAFDDAVSGLIEGGGLRSTHERVRADLRNRVRGRVLLGPLVRNFGRGFPDLIPCEFPSLEMDNPVNRILRWAVHLAALAAADLPAVHDLTDRFRAAQQNFAGVTLIRPRPGSIPTRESLSPGMRHYHRALHVARLLIDSIHLDAKPGETATVTMAINMNDVYERAFLALLHDFVPAAVGHEQWPIELSPPGKNVIRRTKMEPDVWIAGDQSRLPVVIDTKWKDVLSNVAPDDLLVPDEETKTIRLRSTDLYQIVAYALECVRRMPPEEATRGCVAALVYPTLTELPDFGLKYDMGEAGLDIRFVAWNLRRPLQESIEDLWGRLRTAAEEGAAAIEPVGV